MKMHPILIKLVILTILSSGCGTLVGNPKRPDSDTAPTIAQVIELPFIDFVLPESVTALGGEENSDEESALRLGLTSTTAMGAANTSGFTLLHLYSDRADRIVRDINKLIRRLRDDKVRSTGRFKTKGPDGKLSGNITEIDDPDADFQAVVCYEDQPALEMRFSKSGDYLQITQNFAKNPVGESLKTELRSQVEFRKTADAREFAILTQGRFPQSSSRQLRYDGPNLIEKLRFSRTDSGEFAVSGVSDWYDQLPSDGSFEGDAYIVGRINADGSGESVGYRKANQFRCRFGFDEEDPNLFSALPTRGEPTWCLAQALGSDQPYSDEEKLAALTRLESVGLTTKSELKPVSFSASANCEAGE